MSKIKKSDCAFYHSLDFPNGESVKGLFDYQDTEFEYFGREDMSGKRVLEVGTANGSHAFYLENLGCDVVTYDLSPRHSWDLLLSFDDDREAIEKNMRVIIKKTNDGFKYCRDMMGSKLKPNYGSVYDVPAKLGKFDAVFFGTMLVHVRDPLLPIIRIAPRTDTIMIADLLPNWSDGEPMMKFLPALKDKRAWGGWSWWHITPELYVNALTILGFTDIRVEKSEHLYHTTGKPAKQFTVVAKR